jgi:hypothetical protein
VSCSEHSGARYVLVLTYPQALYGVTKRVVERIESAGVGIQNLLPARDACRLVDTKGQTAAARMLLVGVVTFSEFGYSVSRGHARRALARWLEQCQQRRTSRLPSTVLDMVSTKQNRSAQKSQELSTQLKAKSAHQKLSLISVVERHGDRAQRLQVLLESIFPGSAADTVSDEPGLVRRANCRV